MVCLCELGGWGWGGAPLTPAVLGDGFHVRSEGIISAALRRRGEPPEQTVTCGCRRAEEGGAAAVKALTATVVRRS